MQEKKTPHSLISHVQIAIQHIDNEINTIILSIKYPERFISDKKNKKFQSPLHWSNKFPAIGLSKILCALSLLGTIELPDGSVAPFTVIVEFFEQFLNVKLGNAQDVKKRVLQRKLTLTKFIDLLKNTLKAYYETH